MGWWQSENTHEATCAVVPRSHILYVLYLNLHNLVLYPKYHSVLYQSTYIRVLGLSLSSPRKMYTNSLLRYHLVFSAPRNASRLILSCRIWNLGLKYDYICIQWTWKGIIKPWSYTKLYTKDNNVWCLWMYPAFGCRHRRVWGLKKNQQWKCTMYNMCLSTNISFFSFFLWKYIKKFKRFWVFIFKNEFIFDRLRMILRPFLDYFGTVLEPF